MIAQSKNNNGCSGLAPQAWFQLFPAGWITAALLLGILCMVPGCNEGESPVKPQSIIFYPPLPQRPKIQFLRMLNMAEDIEPKERKSGLLKFVAGEDDKETKKIREINRAYGMAWWQNKLYVCDIGGGQGAVFDFENSKFRFFGREMSATSSKPRLRKPVNIWISPKGEKYISDTQKGIISVFDGEDRWVRSITVANGFKPGGAVVREGRLWVSDLQRNAILVMDSATGRILRQVGEKGSAPGQFGWPTNIAFGPGGHLYVTGTLNARVQKFNRRGSLVRVIGSRGLRYGQMVRPKGIAIDRDDRLYVVDSATQVVQVFDTDGRILMAFGGAGSVPGSMSMPAGIHISYEGVEYFQQFASPDFKLEYLIFVSNNWHPRNKINVYGYGTYTGVVPDELPENRGKLRGFYARLAEEMNFTDQQMTKAEGFVRKRAEDQDAWDLENGEKLKTLRRQVLEAENTGEDARAKQIRTRIDKILIGQSKIGADCRKAVMSILTKEQRARWQAQQLHSAMIIRFQMLGLSKEQIAKIETLCGEEAKAMEKFDSAAITRAREVLGEKIIRDVLSGRQKSRVMNSRAGTTSRPASRPASQPAGKPATKPVSKPAAKSATKPAAKK